MGMSTPTRPTTAVRIIRTLPSQDIAPVRMMITLITIPMLTETLSTTTIINTTARFATSMLSAT